MTIPSITAGTDRTAV